jgi:hypothetical protein|tara:strand:+ start:1193 stop:1732 length:540 start_codon:yes stop_codon:yes gene_type:complete
MAVVIKIGPSANIKKVRLEINARQALNGDVMIFDHGDIDIVLSPGSKKVVIFPKETMSDLVYGAQNRLMTHLIKRGILIPESIQAGAYFGALEGTIQQSINPDISGEKLALINISSFIEEERPYFENKEAIISAQEDEIADPSKERSTEIGEVPQSTNQGSMKQNFIRDPYSLNYMYTI